MPQFVGRLRTPRATGPAPTAPTAGEMYFDNDDNTLYWWNGTAWISAGAPEVTVGPDAPAPRVGQTIWVDTDEGLATAAPPQTVLIGAPMPWLVAGIPTGFLEFNGQAIVQATYPELYRLFGAALPDLRGRTLLGANPTYPIGTPGGAATVALTGPQSGIRNHAHSGTTGTDGAHTHTLDWYVPANDFPGFSYANVAQGTFAFSPHRQGGNATQITGTGSGGSTHSHAFNTNNPTGGEVSGSAHENLPPYMPVYWITKAG